MNPAIQRNFIGILLIIVLGLSGCGGGGTGGAGEEGAGEGVAGGGTSVATADAGNDQTAGRTATVTLNGSGSSDSAGATLTYEWQQTRGTDVTAGAGVLTGVTPSFNAPNTVETLTFALSVNGSATDTVHVNVLEHGGSAFFVDGDNGSDASGDGSMSAPYATISHAIDQISSANTDIYVRTRSGTSYDETSATLFPPVGTSVYGGYGTDWVRDLSNNLTAINGNNVSIHFNDVADIAWVSGFDLVAANSADASTEVSAISTTAGTATLSIEDNTITAGDVGAGSGTTSASSYGLRLSNVNAVRISGNTVSAGNGGNGSNGVDGRESFSGGGASAGLSRSGAFVGNPGDISGCSNQGGQGGDGGVFGFGTNGARGGDGCAIFDSISCDGIGTDGSGGAGGAGGSGGFGATDGSPGAGGDGGSGGDGGTGGGEIASGGFYLGNQGDSGQSDHSARGGGGGVEAGAVGHGGGGGGAGGGGGRGGLAGGASIGILLHGVTDTLIENNKVSSAAGGDAGNGGLGGGGGNGGTGGNGAEHFLLSSDGGHGGDAGSGGLGGRNGRAGSTGGVGATLTSTSKAVDGSESQGGWSYGIFDIDPNDGQVPSLSGNTITAGFAGAGGQSGEFNF